MTSSRPRARSAATRQGSALLALAATPATAFAHAAHPGRRVGWSDWNFDPLIVIGLGLLGGMYALGIRRLRGRIEARESAERSVVGKARVLAFSGGMLALVVALVSPLDQLSDQLAWVHMVQHMLLMTVAAPLIVSAAPLFVCLWGLARRGRIAFSRVRRKFDLWGFPWYALWQPLLVWIVYAVTMWVWHLPALYEAALRDPLIHDFQHLAFFATACLYWRVLLDPLSRFRLDRGLAVLYLFTTTLHAMLLGVFMTLARTPWYADYDGRTQLWGLTPLEDQQLAGAIMWMPACFSYVIVAAILFAEWLRTTDESASLDPRPMHPTGTVR
ncbi:MAG: cytochrome c oxidase assembly protein [Planctomycetaceae bacterium]